MYSVQKRSDSHYLKRPGILAILFVLLLTMSCDSAEKDQRKVYFDLQKFVENQIVYLSESHPIVTKTVQLEGKQEVVKTDDVDWKKELSLFSQADLNKPALFKSYQVTRMDSFTYEYQAKAGENLAVQYLLIKTDSTLRQPVLVRAIIKSENKVYNSEKNIELICEKSNNVMKVKKYSITGFQKLIATKKKPFSVEVKIGL